MKTIIICSNCKSVQEHTNVFITDSKELANLLYAKAFTPNQLDVVKVSRCFNCRKNDTNHC